MDSLSTSTTCRIAELSTIRGLPQSPVSLSNGCWICCGGNCCHDGTIAAIWRLPAGQDVCTAFYDHHKRTSTHQTIIWSFESEYCFTYGKQHLPASFHHRYGNCSVLLLGSCSRRSHGLLRYNGWLYLQRCLLRLWWLWNKLLLMANRSSNELITHIRQLFFLLEQQLRASQDLA